jgi:alkylhydroperoxidase family enzyme
MDSGPEALVRHAPVAAASLAEIGATVWPVADRVGLADLVELAGRVCAGQHGLAPLKPPPHPGRRRWAGVDPQPWREADGLTGAERDAIGFAAQFSLDVAAVSDRQRQAVLGHLGSAAGDFVAAVFVIDFLPRATAALDALYGPVPSGSPAEVQAAPAAGIWEAFDTFIRAVPRLDALDPVTSELVRLRGARQHRCRLCQSLRSRPALLAGADDGDFGAVDDYRDSDLSAAQKAALAFTDAMLWTPGHIDSEVVGALTAHLSEAQGVELVLDITRNALNKIAVALAADAPHVEDGIEIYDIDADGELVYGLTLD